MPTIALAALVAGVCVIATVVRSGLRAVLPIAAVIIAVAIRPVATTTAAAAATAPAAATTTAAAAEVSSGAHDFDSFDLGCEATRM